MPVDKCISTQLSEQSYLTEKNVHFFKEKKNPHIFPRRQRLHPKTTGIDVNHTF